MSAARGLLRVARNGDLSAVGATKLPDGQITEKSVQPLLQKYSAFAVGQITSRTRAVLSPRGALAIVTNVGTGCGGRGSVGRVT